MICITTIILREQHGYIKSETLTGPCQQCRERKSEIIHPKINRGIKYTMSNDDLDIYTGYQYGVDVQATR
jgi:hypothetical protein